MMLGQSSLKCMKKPTPFTRGWFVCGEFVSIGIVAEMYAAHRAELGGKKANTSFRHYGMQCLVLAIAFDLNAQFLSRFKLTQAANEYRRRINLCITNLQNHVTGFQLQIVVGPGFQYQHTAISFEVLTQSGINLCQL